MSEEQTTEQTPETQDQSTEKPAPAQVPQDVLAAYNNVLAEKDRQVRDALAKLEALETRLTAPPQMTPEESSKKFFENPVELIRNEINAALAPVQKTIQSFTQRNQYAELKAQMVQDPRFKDLGKIEREFDNLMNNQVPEPNAMIAAYYAAYGMVASNEPNRLFGGSTEKTPETPKPKPADTMPPHLRPSTPLAPSASTPATKRPPLTENERLLMRMNGIKSEDEWFALMDARPDTVIHKPEAK